MFFRELDKQVLVADAPMQGKDMAEAAARGRGQCQRRWSPMPRGPAITSGHSWAGCRKQAPRLNKVVLVDHQPDLDDPAHALPAHIGIEDEAHNALVVEPRLGDSGLEAVEIAGEFDEGHYQGTTSPAAASSAVGLRPSIALRWGKRPN